jgi:hypothetical protein
VSEICPGAGRHAEPDTIKFDPETRQTTVRCPACARQLAPQANGKVRRHSVRSSSSSGHVYEEMPPDPGATLEEARAWLRLRREEGAKCPCCKQLTRVYRRRLNSGMARALVLLYKAGGTDWVHKPTILGGVGAAARDESLLRYWGLLAEADARRQDGGRAGWWRVTLPGAEFVLGERLVPEYVVVYDSRALRTEGKMIDIQMALGNRFNLDDLLGRAF